MVVLARLEAPTGTSLKSLVNGFVLTKQTDGKSPRTVEFYSKNLKLFVWYSAQKHGLMISACLQNAIYGKSWLMWQMKHNFGMLWETALKFHKEK